MSDPIEIQAGLGKKIIRAGNGEQLKTGDVATVHCKGMLMEDRKKFWSTRDPGQQPFTFTIGVGEVIQGWDRGCLSMKIGEVAELYIQPVLGYGRSGFPAWGIPPDAPLIFEIEVLSKK